MGRKYYITEEKLAAVKLYIKYDFSPSAVIHVSESLAYRVVMERLL